MSTEVKPEVKPQIFSADPKLHDELYIAEIDMRALLKTIAGCEDFIEMFGSLDIMREQIDTSFERWMKATYELRKAEGYQIKPLEPKKKEDITIININIPIDKVENTLRIEEEKLRYICEIVGSGNNYGNGICVRNAELVSKKIDLISALFLKLATEEVDDEEEVKLVNEVEKAEKNVEKCKKDMAKHDKEWKEFRKKSAFVDKYPEPSTKSSDSSRRGVSELDDEEEEEEEEEEEKPKPKPKKKKVTIKKGKKN